MQGSVKRDLPPLPEWAQIVSIAKPKAGEDVLLIAARERAGRGEANRRLSALSRWYDCLRNHYQGGACNA